MKQIPETMGERIRLALEAKKLSQIKAGRMIGVDRNTVGLWIKGAEVPEKQLARLADIVERSRAWLRYGVVEASGAAVERYVTGFIDGRERAIELLSRMEPEPENVLGVEPVDAKPPREVEREAEPFGAARSQRNPKQA